MLISSLIYLVCGLWFVVAEVNLLYVFYISLLTHLRHEIVFFAALLSNSLITLTHTPVYNGVLFIRLEFIRK